MSHSPSKKRKKPPENSIQVAVRVRPLKKNEILRNQSNCIEMVDNTTVASDGSGNDYRYTYDYSYWSIEDGSKEFASQEMVYYDLGAQVVEQAFDGYNSCLFAYGQTGSGKSYTVFGDSKNPGLIPRLCRDLFCRIEEEKAKPDCKTIQFRVEVSMIEIYNEKVRDLFNPTNPKNSVGLKVRENPKTGPFVEGLTFNLAREYDELKTMMEEGSKLRTIGATNMNDTSSRAHTLFQIIFTQVFNWSQKTKKKGSQKNSKKGQRVAKINLIDLAGSERQDKAQTSGQRLKEGAAINLSLTMLGNVINRLADNSSLTEKGYVPYRDSKLTWLLKESLGGNSKTVMIATVSPALMNFQETLSTLRYANRAKDIKNHAVVNEDPQSKLINELRNEIDRLKGLLSEKGGEGLQQKTENIVKTLNQVMEPKDGVEIEKNRLESQLLESQRIINQLQMSDEERLEQTKMISEQRKRALKEAGVSADYSRKIVPHIVNLNADPFLSENLLYFFKPNATTHLGKASKGQNIIVLSGEEIEDEHCYFENIGNKKVFINPQKSKKKKSGLAPLYVNGKRVLRRMEVHTHDRIIVGKHHFFRFQNPNEKKKSVGDFVDWEFMKKEMVTHLEKEMSKKRKEEEEKMKKEFDEKRDVEEEKIKALVEQRKVLQESVSKIQGENIMKKQEDQLRVEEIKFLEQDVREFQEKLMYEQSQKELLESESKRNIKKVSSLKHYVEDLRRQLIQQREETLKLEIAHHKEKKILENQTVALQDTMQELQEKLKNLEGEQRKRKKENLLQKKKLDGLKKSVESLQHELKNEMELKRKLKEESEKLAESEKIWRNKHLTSKNLLIMKTKEQAQLLPVLQQMMIAQDSTHRKQIQILQDKLSEQRKEIFDQQQSHSKVLVDQENAKNEQKSGFVSKLLKQIDELMLDKQMMGQKLKEKESVDVSDFKGKIYKLKSEKLALQRINMQLDTLAKDRLEIIKVLEKNLQESEIFRKSYQE